MKLLVKDESFAGETLNSIEVDLSEELVTVKDIITSRVTTEVERYNQKSEIIFNGLVQPSDTEKVLNGYKLKKKKTIDVEKQVYIALERFQNNGYFVLIDDVQAESLEQVVLLKPNTRISFIKLTALVGG